MNPPRGRCSVVNRAVGEVFLAGLPCITNKCARPLSCLRSPTHRQCSIRFAVPGFVSTFSAIGRPRLSELRVVEADDISSLIEQLSDVKFQTREEATREILYLGPSVIPQLEAAAKNTTGETALRARSLVRILAGSPQTSAARQLMAIRTLGELRHRAAIGPLQGFLKSEKPFVADYAARAIARIEGKPSPRHRPTQAELDEDVWILPAKCAVVGQAALVRPIPLSFEKALEKMGPG